MMKLDEFDLKIIDELQLEGRLTNAELASRIGLSPSPCLRRVRHLEAEGIIQGYAAKIDRTKVGLGLTVFVEVRLARHTTPAAHRFDELIQGMPEVMSCHLVTGESDYLLEISVSDLDRYSRTVVKKLRDIKGIQYMRSHIALETIKRSAHLPPALIETPE
jgi:Lrp/AsnC family transcriptional regulator, leucine-responsive regulatory protein